MTQRLEKRAQKNAQRSLLAQPLDRTAVIAMVVLSVVIALMLMTGAQALPQVKSFSWQEVAVKAEDAAFILTFTQPMEPTSVEENLVIEPPLDGKISWAGRRMAYTLNAPAPYGESFELSLPTAQAINGQEGFDAFQAGFRTRDRAFAYIGASGEEAGRLVLFNLTQKEKTILTTPEQTVLNFEPYPERDRILYSAVDTASTETGISSAQLYTVTTGMGADSTSPAWQFWKREETVEPGTVTLVLDSKEYQNLKFDLSPNGETIVVQRVNRERPADSGPWVIKSGEDPERIKTEPGGDFKIAPDSTSLLFQQGQGTAVIDLEPEETATNPDSLLLDFLPEYGLTLDVADDGSAAAFVNFNQNDPENRFTQSLYWVSNRGDEKQLLRTDGAILSAQFNENGDLLYCLVNRLLRTNQSQNQSQDELSAEDTAAENKVLEGEVVEGEDALSVEITPLEAELDLSKELYSFSPYLSVINVGTGEEKKLLEMPPQPEITVSLSPDGLAILFDEVLASDMQGASDSETYDGPTHRLWLLPLFDTLEARMSREPTALPPTELDIAGRHPAWLP